MNTEILHISENIDAVLSMLVVSRQKIITQKKTHSI